MRKVLGYLLEKAVNFTSSFSLFMRIMQKWKRLRTHSHYPLRISVGRLIIFHHLWCATQNESEKIKVCNLECIRRKKIPLLFLALNVWLLFFFFWLTEMLNWYKNSPPKYCQYHFLSSSADNQPTETIKHC